MVHNGSTLSITHVRTEVVYGHKKMAAVGPANPPFSLIFKPQHNSSHSDVIASGENGSRQGATWALRANRIWYGGL